MDKLFSSGRLIKYAYLHRVNPFDNLSINMQISRKETRWGDTSFLLGGWSGPKKDGELSMLNGNPTYKPVAAAISFSIATERLTSIEKDEGSNELHLKIPEVEEISKEEREEDTIQG